MTRSSLASSSTIHIAVLECEKFPQNIVQSHGNFSQIFRDWLASGTRKFNSRRTSLAHQHVTIETSTWLPKTRKYPTCLDDVDALIVTGSVHSVYEDIPWIKELQAYISDVYRSRPHIKIFGGCFGHQIIAQALLGQAAGVHIEKSRQGWEIGVHDIKYTEAFTEYFPNLVERHMRHQFLHSDEVTLVDDPLLPAGWTIIGSSKLCPVQGLFEPGRVLTYQGHPEFDRDILRDFVTRLLRRGTLDLVSYELSLKLLDKEDNGSRALAAEVVVDFLVGVC